MDSNTLAKKELTHGERFTEKVMMEFKASAGGELAISDFQKRLVQNYFIAIDAALRTAEERRKKAKEEYRDKVPVTWENVNMNSLAVDAVNLARLGLDSAQKNHINFIPFKNNNTGKYEVGFIEGYVGLEYKAKKYAQEMPVEVVCELVYSNDVFKPIKRGPSNAYESYDFDIPNPFDRGEVMGGFAYFIYSDPNKNKLMMMTLKGILKRKPKKASAEFWGGEKPKYENRKIVGSEHVEGWFEEMCLKTIKRAAYGSIPLDPQKVDENYMHMRQREQDFAELEAQQEIDENANKEIIDIPPEDVKDTTDKQAAAETPAQETEGKADPEQAACGF